MKKHKLLYPGDKVERLLLKEKFYIKSLAYWVCKCDCGNTKTIMQANINAGYTKSCGCINKEKNTKHNLYGTYKYKLWTAINKRCYNKNSESYNRYGKRGISVYCEWRDSPTLFIKYLEDALGERPSKLHSLDRIDNNGNYEPGNLRWATVTEQSRNRSSNKLNKEDVKFIKHNKDKYSNKDFSTMFNVSKTTILDILKGRTWKEI